MIPIHLKLNGFLSYRDPVELDFTSFHLACISGSNGAGKSSLLDAITWVLFGQARKRDESVVNLQSKSAEVAFIFSYEENTYRVIRTLARGKTTILEFQIAQDTGRRSSLVDHEIAWRPLTEHSVRETQARIEQTLRLDYETFINVSFFLQGRADQFTQQPPTKRKEILGSILGLEIWELYRERAAGQRKTIERDLDSIDGRLQEIDAELAEEPQRKERLAVLELELKHLTTLRKAQETALANLKQARTTLEKQKELVQKLGSTLEYRQLNLSAFRERLVTKQSEHASHAVLLARADEIESSYAAWMSVRQELEHWEGIAANYRQQEKRRQPFLDEINTARAKLEQERYSLEQRLLSNEGDRNTSRNLEAEIKDAHSRLVDVDLKLAEREDLLKRSTEAREKQVELRAANAGLKAEMDELDLRINKLRSASGAACPLCGQPLSPEHRQSTLAQLSTEGKAKGDQWRSNKTILDDLAQQVTTLDSQINALASKDTERIQLSNLVSQLTERFDNNNKAIIEWEQQGAMRLAEVTSLLEGESYAEMARKKLVEMDRELAEMGYDASTHDALRNSESRSRNVEIEFRTLESARSAITPLEDEIINLQFQIDSFQSEISSLQKDFDDAVAVQASLEASTPDLASAELALFEVQEQENRLNQEVGGARQNVGVLDDLRVRKQRLQADREECAQKIGQYKALERAFGKDGVPSLLIEQALPEIETKANELLDRLSDGVMSVRFVTQSAYKDKKREDLKETLDILISDGAGVRDYEMYSGGEAFRVNFAIRLALSEMLASRKGARLQMLVIDEGFGSQDSMGRQRLIQAIRAVQDDFAKILVITHLDELKDSFPTRIEVEKTQNGSVIAVS